MTALTFGVSTAYRSDAVKAIHHWPAYGRIPNLICVVALLFTTLAACGTEASTDAPTSQPTAPHEYPAGDLLVSADWLYDHLDDPSLRIVDLSALADYRRGHIPRAIHLWWEDTIEVNNETYGMMVGEPGVAEMIATAGIEPETTVILYDASGNQHAARFFWLLNAVGFENVRILNGGRHAWQAQGYRLDRDQPSVVPGAIDQQITYDVLIGADTILQEMDNNAVVILDNRTDEERQETWFDALRIGQIPGTVNVPWTELVQNGEVPYYREPDFLRQRFESLGVTSDKTVIVYGQHGVLAAQTYVALKLLGYPAVRVYDGSWAEWGARADLPIESF